MLQVKFSGKHLNQESDGYFVLLDEKLEITKLSAYFDQHVIDMVSQVVSNKQMFSGKYLQTKTMTINLYGYIKHLVLLGVGDQSKLNEHKIEALGGKIVHNSNCFKLKISEVIMPDRLGDIDIEEAAALIASGASLCSYRFDKYMTKEKPEDKPAFKNIIISLSEYEGAHKRFSEYYDHIIQGVYLARDVVSEVPNVLYPDSYAEIIEKELSGLGVKVTVLDEDDMSELNMNALLGVGQGSVKRSKLVIMEYKNSYTQDKPVGFVGKGVCFDTGGISLKPADGMWDMKYDMAGSAAVVGAVKALALRKAKVHVVGVVGLVENMPDGNAQRPGDVVISASGQTIEVLNTDAEGRLVLADALWYIQKYYDPKIIVDLATLTGAITIALGALYAGGFSNNDDLVNNVIQAGEKVDEKVWRLPLHEHYDHTLKSDCADMANITPSYRGLAGSITAAQFLQRFIDKNRPWVHLDIAGTAWNKHNAYNFSGKCATGYGVRLLNRLVRDVYEDA